MKRGGTGQLTAEDRILWSRVARTAKPLPGKAHPDEKTDDVPPESEFPPAPPSFADGIRPVPTPEQQAGFHPRRLDAPTREKLARGRIDIAGRVDLHGLTQQAAHRLLLAFLREAFASGRRHVLVITGKGTGAGEGVLRRSVPQWFATPPFAAIVSGYEEAARRHGGAGALYVRLRRRERVR